MFTCTLEAASKTPLRAALYRAETRDGARRDSSGERMPSKRELAAHLSVSTATVEAAYARLISEGFLRAAPEAAFMRWNRRGASA